MRKRRKPRPKPRRIADHKKLGADERRRYGLRTNEEGTCAWCGKTLPEGYVEGSLGGYDDLWCSLECARWFARASHQLGTRFKDIDERGGVKAILSEAIDYHKKNPGDDEDKQQAKRRLVDMLEAVLADWEEKQGS